MSSSARVDGGFLRSARTVSALTLLSRVLGLARDMATARLLGAGVVNDALTYAWTVPNAFRRLFGEGALSSAFIPVFTRTLERDGKERARVVANNLVSAVGLFLVVLVAVLVVALSVLPQAWLTAVLGQDSAATVALTSAYTRLLLPYLAVICVIAQLMAVLNALDEFAVPAFAPILLNLVWLTGVGVAAWWGAGRAGEAVREQQGYVIAGAILVASVLQLAWHLPAMRRLGVGLALVRPRRTPELREVLTVMGPMLVGMGCAQVNILADRTIALGALEHGGTTHLYYGLRIMQFPLGLVSVALATAVYPALARLMSRDDRPALAATASLALRMNLLVSLPAALGLLALAGPVVRLFFEGGAFDAESARLTARALVGYAAGIPFVGTVMLLNRACYAAGDVHLPLRTGLLSVAVNVALDLALVGPLGELGLALATSITALLTAVGLLVGFRVRAGLRREDALLGGLLPTLVLAALVGAAAFGLDALLAGWLPAGRLALLARVLAVTAVGLGVFAALAGRLCPEEWGALLARRPPPEE